MKPKVSRRIRVKNRSGSFETSLSPTTIRPSVGRPMQAIRLSSEVLPEPLGPLSTATPPLRTVNETSSTALTWSGWPGL